MTDQVKEPASDELLCLLAAGETRSEGLAGALGIPGRTVRYQLGRLRHAGLVAAPRRGRWQLTGAGQRAALSVTVPEPLVSGDALASLPAEHRATLRLIEDAVIARRALYAVHLTNWPGFILLGPTKSGKTMLGQLAARRFGLDPRTVIVMLLRESEGSLLGRRVQDGPNTWRLAPSRWPALPLVVLDEFDKAAPELRQAAFAYLAGQSHYHVEDSDLDVNATPVLTLNAERDAGRLLPDAYLRRAVVLDTTELREATADLDETARLLARVALPEVGPDLAPPAAELPDAARHFLRRLLRACLTERGWELVDVETIARLALGRWALTPADPVAAVLSVAADYLLVTASRPGLVEPDWPARFEAQAGRPDVPILVVARARQAAGEARQAAKARADLDASLELAGRRDSLIGALDHARESAPRSQDRSDAERRTIDTARGKARLLREAIAAARSLGALDELEVHLAQEILVPLRLVADAVEGRRQAAIEVRQRDAEARHREVVRKQAGRAAAQAARRGRKSRHAELQRLYRRSVTRPGEDVIGTLVEAGCLAEQRQAYPVETWGSRFGHSALGRRIQSLGRTDAPAPATAPDPWAAWLPAVVQPPPAEPARRYETRVHVWYVDRASRRVDEADLLAWGSDSVRAVVATAADAEQLPRLTLPRRRAAARARRSPPPRRRS